MVIGKELGSGEIKIREKKVGLSCLSPSEER